MRRATRLSPRIALMPYFTSMIFTNPIRYLPFIYLLTIPVVILANNNLKELESLANRELGNVNEWLNANKLSLNMKKSNFVIFRPRQKNMPFIPRIRILDSVTNAYPSLEMKDYVKYLGLMIDSNLSWKYQIESICHKITKSIGIIAKIRYFVPPRVLLTTH